MGCSNQCKLCKGTDLPFSHSSTDYIVAGSHSNLCPRDGPGRPLHSSHSPLHSTPPTTTLHHPPPTHHQPTTSCIFYSTHYSAHHCTPAVRHQQLQEPEELAEPVQEVGRDAPPEGSQEPGDPQKAGEGTDRREEDAEYEDWGRGGGGPDYYTVFPHFSSMNQHGFAGQPASPVGDKEQTEVEGSIPLLALHPWYAAYMTYCEWILQQRSVKWCFAALLGHCM